MFVFLRNKLSGKEKTAQPKGEIVLTDWRLCWRPKKRERSSIHSSSSTYAIQGHKGLEPILAITGQKSGAHLMSNVWIKWKSHIVTLFHSIPPNLTCISQEMWQHTESTKSATTWMTCKVAVRSFQIPVKVSVPTERLDLQTDLIHVCLWMWEEFPERIRKLFT